MRCACVRHTVALSRLPATEETRARSGSLTPGTSGTMDIDAFLAAQLWLRRLSAETWPLADRESSEGSGGGVMVILAQATCCFLLEDRPSAAPPPPPRVSRSSSDNTNPCGARRDSGPGSRHASGGGARSGSSPSSRQLWFSTRNAAAASAVEPEAINSACGTKGNPNPGPSGDRSSDASSSRRDNPAEADKGRGVLFNGSYLSRFQLDNSGTVRARGRGEGQRQHASARSTATAAAAAATAVEADDADTVPLKREFGFGLAISRRPRREGRGGGGGGGGGTLLLRIGGEVFQAEHTLIRSIAYPRGGGGGGRDGGGRGAANDDRGDRNAAKGRGDEGFDSSRGRGSSPEGIRRSQAAPGAGLPPLRPPPTAPPGTAATAAAAATGTKRTLDAPTADGAGGIADIGCGPGGRPAVIGKRGRVEGGFGVAGVAGGSEGAADPAATAAASEDGEDGEEEGMPFCGLFFPGVLLKFWLPQRADYTAGARAEAVARLQGVVSSMMAGLSPSPRCTYPRGGGGGGGGGSGGGTVAPELDAEIRSVVAEGEENGFRSRCEAWDEFVFGSHVLLHQERASSLRQRGGSGGGGGCGDAGGPAGSRACARRSGIGSGIDPAVLSGSGLPARGHVDAQVEDDGPSDVGRARALACLAECFSKSKAGLQSSVKLSAQRLLQDEAASAGRALEDALERAFPLDLSQGADTSTRASVVSELEACLHRVQAARKAALTLTLLPASEMLEESGDSA